MRVDDDTDIFKKQNQITMHEDEDIKHDEGCVKKSINFLIIPSELLQTLPM